MKQQGPKKKIRNQVKKKLPLKWGTVELKFNLYGQGINILEFRGIPKSCEEINDF
ncbi:hypothetical protein M901_1954 [Bacteriovorax sp. DB6_IX]|nr:hypothetical protein M901_1954 [Bacteriovorax sp. DB6_IX]